MKPLFIASALIGRHGVQWDVWEYDMDRPRLNDATDIRARYSVVGFIDSFRSKTDADLCVARCEAARGVPK